MKKFKTLMLAGATAATIAAPIAATVSCGSASSYAGRYDAKVGSTIKIMTSFSATQLQYKGLDTVVNAWNALADSAKPAGWMKAELIHVEGGYSAIHKNLSMAFEAKDSDKLPNLIVDYPDSLGTLAKYDMQVELASAANKSAIQNLFSKDFLSVNDQIGGIDAGGLYTLPIAKAIDMATFNKPVFVHLLSELEAKHWITLTNKPSWTDTTDNAAVAKIWGDAVEAPANSAKAFDFEKIKTDASELLDFITVAGKAFTSKSKDAYVLGIDSATNFVYQSVYQKVKAEMNNFLFAKGKDGYISYNWESNPVAKAAFAEVYGKLQAAIEAKGVYVNTGGAYSSNFETQHKIALAYGSTAGYKYNFIKASSSTPAALDASGSKIAFASTNAVSTADATADILAKFGTYKNNLFSSSYTGTVSQYDVKIDAAKEAETKAFLAAHTSNVFLATSADAAKIADHIEVAHGKFLVVLPLTSGAADTMQEEEMEVDSTASSFGGESTASQLIQGPSLIGVHNNATEDAAMQSFINWYMTDSAKPYQTFANEAGYIVPTKEVLAKTDADLAALKFNPAQKLTFDTLRQIESGSIKGFDNPADDTTGDFRETLQSTIATAYTRIANGEKSTFNVDEIYSAVKRSLDFI